MKQKLRRQHSRPFSCFATRCICRLLPALVDESGIIRTHSSEMVSVLGTPYAIPVRNRKSNSCDVSSGNYVSWIEKRFSFVVCSTMSSAKLFGTAECFEIFVPFNKNYVITRLVLQGHNKYEGSRGRTC
jgi:hypothetical protein